MNSYKQAKKALLAMLVFGILPGCGHNNGNGTTVGVSGVTSSSVGLSGNSCYYLNGSIGQGSGATLTFAGSGTVNYDGSITALVTGNTGFGFGGQTYGRSNAAGDSMQVWLSNTGVGQTSVQVVANLSSTTVAYFQMYNAPVCGLYINSYVAGGQLTLSAPYLTQSGGYGGGYGSYGGYSYAGISL